MNAQKGPGTSVKYRGLLRGFMRAVPCVRVCLEANHFVAVGHVLGTVRHQDRGHRAGASRGIQVGHERTGGIGVQVRGRFVQQQNRRVHQQGASHRQALTLTARQEGTAGTHGSAQALRQGVKPLAQTHATQNLDELLLAGTVGAVAGQQQVTLEGRLEDVRRLRAPGRVAAQLFGGQRLAGGLDAARLQGQEAQQGSQHGGLAGS